jgi:AcrR family transcriptional regulator
MTIAGMVSKVAAAPASPPRDRAEGTRRQILDAAANAFASHGYHGVSLNDIVRESGLTKGAFYFHFPSKEALALEVFRTKQEQWVSATMAAVMATPRAIDRLNAMLDCGCDLYETDASARVVGRLCVELSRDPQLAPKLTVFLTVWFDIVAGLIRQAQSEGDARRDIDPTIAAETIVSAYLGVEQVSDALSGMSDMRRRMEGLRTMAMAAIQPCS